MDRLRVKMDNCLVIKVVDGESTMERTDAVMSSTEPMPGHREAKRRYPDSVCSKRYREAGLGKTVISRDVGCRSPVFLEPVPLSPLLPPADR